MHLRTEKLRAYPSRPQQLICSKLLEEMIIVLLEKKIPIKANCQTAARHSFEHRGADVVTHGFLSIPVFIILPNQIDHLRFLLVKRLQHLLFAFKLTANSNQ